MDNYNRGNSGYGNQVGGDARAWQEYNRGQQERQRRLDQENQQRQNQERQRQQNLDRQRQINQNNSQPGEQGKSDTDYSPDYDTSNSGIVGYTVFCVFVFVAFAIYGLDLLGKSTPPETVKMLTQYIGPNGYVSKDVFFWAFVAIVVVIGILLRKILRWIVPLGIVSGIIWGIIQLN